MPNSEREEHQFTNEEIQAIASGFLEEQKFYIERLTKIQATVRGFLDRQKFNIKPLKNNELKDYPTFAVGNDPQMPKELDQYHNPNEPIALIATSGMRPVSLACKLGNSNHIPKIILVDNSKDVIAFWHAMRDFIEDNTKSGTKELFSKHFPDFLKNNQHLYRNFSDENYKKYCTDKVKYLNQNVDVFFKALIKKYGYDYVRNVIKHTSIIPQSWADSNTFVKIKNILTHLGINQIYLYPSNIVACVKDEKIQNQILENIYKMAPVLSIHTMNSRIFIPPDQVILIKNNEPKVVFAQFFKSTQTTHSKMLDLNDLINLLNTTANNSNNPVQFKIG
jgi:hypothetical protein